MKLPDGTVLMHGADPYDPVKAHDYYIRTRKLKGRKKGSAPPLSGKTAGSPSFTVDLGGGKVRMTSKELKAQQAYAAERVKEIKDKIAKLHELLKEKMKNAEKADRKHKEALKPDTAAEKADKARESKKYRDKHKQELKTKAKEAASKSGGSSQGNSGGSSDSGSSKGSKGQSEVARLKSSIKKAQAKLTVAINRQKALASATKN